MKTILVFLAVLAAPAVGLAALAAGLLTGPLQLGLVLLFAWPASAVLLWMLLSALTGVRMAGRAGAVGWSGLSKAFHWTLAFAVLGTAALMYYMVNMGDLEADPVLRAEYGRLLKLHKSIGLVVLFAVAFRFAWNRWRPRPPLPDGTTGAQRRAAGATHAFLYLAMLAVPLLGWMASMTYGGRTWFFGLFELPVWLPKNIDWAYILQPAHIWAAWAMLAVVGVHAAAAAWHHFVRRDATLVQMMPGEPRRQPGAR
jgi:cytochrome b561